MTNFDKVVEVYKAGLVIQAEITRVKEMQSTLHLITDDSEYNTRYDEVEVLLDKALYASSDNAEELTKLANVMTVEEKAAFKAFRATQA